MSNTHMTRPDIVAAAVDTWVAGGGGGHGKVAFEAYLRQHSLSLSASCDPEKVALEIECGSSRQVERAFEVLHALIALPCFTNESLALAQSEAQQRRKLLDSSLPHRTALTGLGLLTTAALLDPSPSDMSGFTARDARDLVRELLVGGALEVVVAGDATIEEVGTNAHRFLATLRPPPTHVAHALLLPQSVTAPCEWGMHELGKHLVGGNREIEKGDGQRKGCDGVTGGGTGGEGGRGRRGMAAQDAEGAEEYAEDSGNAGKDAESGVGGATEEEEKVSGWNCKESRRALLSKMQEFRYSLGRDKGRRAASFCMHGNTVSARVAILAASINRWGFSEEEVPDTYHSTPEWVAKLRGNAVYGGSFFVSRCMGVGLAATEKRLNEALHPLGAQMVYLRWYPFEVLPGTSHVYYSLYLPCQHKSTNTDA